MTLYVIMSRTVGRYFLAPVRASVRHTIGSSVRLSGRADRCAGRARHLDGPDRIPLDTGRVIVRRSGVLGRLHGHIELASFGSEKYDAREPYGRPYGSP
jgi:hypothetical protein